MSTNVNSRYPRRQSRHVRDDERYIVLRHNAGARKCRRNPQTGQLVTMYDGVEAGMDMSSGRWQTVCEKHGTILSHRTYELAVSHMTTPLDWCELCRGEWDDVHNPSVAKSLVEAELVSLNCGGTWQSALGEFRVDAPEGKRFVYKHLHAITFQADDYPSRVDLWDEVLGRLLQGVETCPANCECKEITYSSRK